MFWVACGTPPQYFHLMSSSTLLLSSPADFFTTPNPTPSCIAFLHTSTATHILACRCRSPSIPSGRAFQHLLVDQGHRLYRSLLVVQCFSIQSTTSILTVTTASSSLPVDQYSPFPCDAAISLRSIIQPTDTFFSPFSHIALNNNRYRDRSTLSPYTTTPFSTSISNNTSTI